MYLVMFFIVFNLLFYVVGFVAWTASCRPCLEKAHFISVSVSVSDKRSRQKAPSRLGSRSPQQSLTDGEVILDLMYSGHCCYRHAAMFARA